MPKIKKLFACLSNLRFARALLISGVAAGVEHRTVLAQMPRFQTVVDIGANTGQFALVARALFPDADIISFEPLFGPAAKFRKVHGRDSRIRLIRAAVGALDSEADMHVSARADSSSLLPITQVQVDTYPGTQKVASERVRIAPLARLVEPSDIRGPALLKIDVQGYEMQVLQGSEAELHLFQFIYVECSFIEFYANQALAPEITSWLGDRGFRLRRLYNQSFCDGKLVQADHLFERTVCSI